LNRVDDESKDSEIEKLFIIIEYVDAVGKVEKRTMSALRKITTTYDEEYIVEYLRLRNEKEVEAKKAIRAF
jgi:hypothetical protein